MRHIYCLTKSVRVGIPQPAFEQPFSLLLALDLIRDHPDREIWGQFRPKLLDHGRPSCHDARGERADLAEISLDLRVQLAAIIVDKDIVAQIKENRYARLTGTVGQIDVMAGKCLNENECVDVREIGNVVRSAQDDRMNAALADVHERHQTPIANARISRICLVEFPNDDGRALTDSGHLSGL